MLRLEKISIHEFRGIRSLELDLEQENFGICGPNGTGKSGVVDAIEFCLTGDVTRLSGQGTGDLTVKQHAPHVDQRAHPETAYVSVTAFIPSLKKHVTIKRSVDRARTPTITPSQPNILAVVEEVETHPEFALSRREIAKYIVTPPGNRSRDVQTLLRLDDLEQLRTSLTKVANKCAKDTRSAETSLTTARNRLQDALGISAISKQFILAAINDKRALLGLEAVNKLTRHTSFKDVSVETSATSAKPVVKKTAALSDVTALLQHAAAGESEYTTTQRLAIVKELETMKADVTAFKRIQQRCLVEAGLSFVDDDACPLCDVTWSADELRAHLQRKLDSAQEVTRHLNDLRSKIKPFSNAMSLRIEQLDRVAHYCGHVEPKIAFASITKHAEDLRAGVEALSDFAASPRLLEDSITALSNEWHALPSEVTECVAQCKSAIEALPDTSPTDQARDFLVLAQERYDRAVEASNTLKALKEQEDLATRVAQHFAESKTRTLEALYDQVASDFSRLYRLINHEDEHTFEGKLSTPDPAKLSLNVDFYGRGVFPPGAYHSEGHQDGMGLCLYLALMKQTLGQNFTFAVLDDVLMSVDASHRREVCRMLKSEFPDTQFILTTHDPVWLQYMRTEGLIRRSQTFGGWSVDDGPRVWDDKDVWQEISTVLERNDVPAAAFLLRRYLEHLSPALADALRVSVEFRGDGQYDLGTLFPPVLSAWRKNLKAGISAAETWGHADEANATRRLLEEVEVASSRTNAEQWAINRSVHYNEWANFSPNEFRSVVAAFRDAVQTFTCTECLSHVRLSPRYGSSEQIRCMCGKKSINLVRKK